MDYVPPLYRPPSEAHDIREAASQGPLHRRAFLMDGDALILATDKLL